MTLLEAAGLKIFIQDRLLVDVPHLQINERDRIGLVGRNGSGKTTLMQVLAGLRAPDEGVVTARVTCELLPQLKRTDTTRSGGEITQQYILEAFARNPGILFADEPTTNLDTSHLEWLEKRLLEWPNPLVLVSHDRTFLDAVCTTIWEIREGELHIYKGNYSDYAAARALERKQHEAAYQNYMRKKRQLQEAIQLKEQKAAKATKKPKQVSASEAKITGAKPYFAKKQKKLQKTAKSLETRLEKLEQVEQPKELPAIRMNLPGEEVVTGRIILRVEEVAGKVGDRMLWEAASFHVRGGDKLAIVGPNGCGKTTLVKKIVSEEPGITLSPSVKIGYFSQNLNILRRDKSILENVRETSSQSETLVRTVLARLHFFREDVYKPIDVLSGGERVKVALAKLFVSDINMLVLDEPTNFLDIEAVEALEALLVEYPGTILFVSHDRRFVERIASRVLTIRDGRIQLFEGAYGDSLEAKQPATERDQVEEQRMLLETKISEVLSRLSIAPTPELDEEFQRLLAEKKALQ